jgi:hypothetical protein
MPPTVVIRVRPQTRDLLHQLAQDSDETAIDTLERLVREASEAQLLKAVASDLSSALESTDTELAAWDASLVDGLDPHEDFSSWR